MDDFLNIARAHAEKYPAMLPRDAVKLAYQSEFGGGHLVTDLPACAEALKAEWELINKDEAASLSEDIGGGFARLNLAALSREMLPLAAKIFVVSSAPCGTTVGLSKKLAVLRELTAEGAFSFGEAELDEYLRLYELDGRPMVRHTQQYRDSYAPAYRVVDARYVRLLPLLEKLMRLLRQNGSAVVAIDGPCASGKTTAAELIAAVFDCGVVHMDDFFLPLELRTPARYAEAGGNIHYERFKTEAAEPLLAGKALEWGVFDCSVGKITESRRLEKKALTVVEGSYSLHPYFGRYYDLSVFLTIEKAGQQARIRERNGENGWLSFRDRWIPLEHNYFETLGIKDSADIII